MPNDRNPAYDGPDGIFADYEGMDIERPTMTEPALDLDELERLEKAATEGPWFLHDFSGPDLTGTEPVAADVTVSCDHPATITVASMGGGLYGFKGIAQAREDAAFIAALRNAALNLIAAAKRDADNDGSFLHMNAMDQLQAALTAAQARIAELEAGLRLYANPDIYKPHPHGPAFDDRGDLYRNAARLLNQPKDAT